MKCFINILSLILLNTLLYSQQQNIPMGHFFQDRILYEANKHEIAVHTGFKPLIVSRMNQSFVVDSVLFESFYSGRFYVKYRQNLMVRKLLFEDFVNIDKGFFKLEVNPIVYLEKGNTSDTVNYFINTRGIEIKGDLGDKLSFYSGFRENQARFRTYIYNSVRKRLVVPGQGAVKLNNNDLSVFDFSSANGYLSWTPLKFINLQIGQDKHFIGEGYRSLLISDYSANYPFARIGLNYKNFNYTTLFTEFRDFQGSYYDYHFKKHGAFNYLSYNYRNRFEFGLFEGMIYRTTDTVAGYVNQFKADFFIPIPGIRALINGFGDENHLLMGINAKIKLNDNIQIYSQAALDDPSQKKYAYQGGIKIFDLFFSKLHEHKLYFQAEYNGASARTYSHPDNKFLTWSHYNEELAHPIGSDFSEIYARIGYTYKRFHVDFNFNKVTKNKNGSFSDIFITDNRNYLYFPDPVNLKHYTGNVAFVVNPSTGLEIYIGFDQRTFRDPVSNGKENFLMVGLRTDIANFYYDY
jgi:hypothetical protein